MQQTFSVTPREARERWVAIVSALVTSGITPDVVTFAALSLGVDVLAENLGIQEVGKAKRPIGFGPTPGRT